MTHKSPQQVYEDYKIVALELRTAKARIEELEASLEKAVVVLQLISGADWEARLGEAIDIACEILAENMEDEE